MNLKGKILERHDHQATENYEYIFKTGFIPNCLPIEKPEFVELNVDEFEQINVEIFIEKIIVFLFTF
jgi:hypothetical protein